MCNLAAEKWFIEQVFHFTPAYENKRITRQCRSKCGRCSRSGSLATESEETSVMHCQTRGLDREQRSAAGKESLSRLMFIIAYSSSFPSPSASFFLHFRENQFLTEIHFHDPCFRCHWTCRPFDLYTTLLSVPGVNKTPLSYTKRCLVFSLSRLTRVKEQDRGGNNGNMGVMIHD